MLQLLLDNPLLLLFLVSAIGYALGRITVAGTSLGVAAVLFVGLAFGALHPDLKLPVVLYQLGLVLFVYTVGLASGRQFFDSLGCRGLRDNLLVVGMLIAATGLTLALGRLLGLSAGLTAGMFTGSFTNTAALANEAPNIGYAAVYPIALISKIILAQLLLTVLDACSDQAFMASPAALTHPRVPIPARPMCGRSAALGLRRARVCPPGSRVDAAVAG